VVHGGSWEGGAGLETRFSTIRLRKSSYGTCISTSR
jgi:hypothetical protein